MSEWIRDGKGYRRGSDSWTEERHLKGQCEMFLYTSYLYYELDVSVWKDEMFDQHAKYLLDRYSKLPEWFTSRVLEGDLLAGTGFTLKLTNSERWSAIHWVTEVIKKGDLLHY